MHIDEKAVWQRVTAAEQKPGGDPLGKALEDSGTLMGAYSALSTGKEPWPELLRSRRKTHRTLRGLGRLLGMEPVEGSGKKATLRGKTYREKLIHLLEEQEREARMLERLALQLGSPAAIAVEGEAREAWRRWELLLMELGR